MGPGPVYCDMASTGAARGAEAGAGRNTDRQHAGARNTPHRQQGIGVRVGKKGGGASD